ncbi:Uu.00g090950.m01.CDS01 [Anthostomella pinea]|uniref:Uu.00g090950.m01.CDS01 n=1 Tax=Anthostomella pinea TaxID=933095 RepID=A0AAI8VN14_9PEZI|nr:Uu.00g090950.m01.CDS01 [Anthostomella pinea]
MANDGLDPSIDQGGSFYSGNVTVHGGPFHQGNIVNIQQTANQCLIDLCVTDPRHNKKRVQDTKGGLLADLYVWVLGNPNFRQWRDHEDQRLLWVKGDPGKGKTMLLCGIVDHLETRLAQGSRLMYFFCQATIERINIATAVLCGLIFMLLDQDAFLALHIKKKYDVAGKGLF